jgi:hypothetical protein
VVLIELHVAMSLSLVAMVALLSQGLLRASTTIPIADANPYFLSSTVYFHGVLSLKERPKVVSWAL